MKILLAGCVNPYDAARDIEWAAIFTLPKSRWTSSTPRSGDHLEKSFSSLLRLIAFRCNLVGAVGSAEHLYAGRHDQGRSAGSSRPGVQAEQLLIWSRENSHHRQRDDRYRKNNVSPGAGDDEF